MIAPIKRPLTAPINIHFSVKFIGLLLKIKRMAYKQTSPALIATISCQKPLEIGFPTIPPMIAPTAQPIHPIILAHILATLSTLPFLIAFIVYTPYIEFDFGVKHLMQ